MANWAIGDIQGCFGALQRLLEAISFDPTADKLWLAGDLVNRGSDSLGVLRWAVDLDRRFPGQLVAVLGNHDLHLLCRAEGLAVAKRRDTLDAVLAAPDREMLLAWLRRQPLVHQAPIAGLGTVTMLHAGILPPWHLNWVMQQAHYAEALLRSPRRRELLKVLVDPGQAVPMAVRVAAEFVGVITRVRCVDRDGKPLNEFSGALEQIPPGAHPWFEAPDRATRGQWMVFGHWAALGMRQGADWIATDAGCVWGQSLAAVRLEDRQVVKVPA